MDVRVLIKHSASKCNKEMLSFLHQNINVIKKKFSLKVIVVYDDLIHTLGSKIKTLPVLIIGNDSVTGNTAIKKYLMRSDTETKTVANHTTVDQHNLTNFWNTEMHSGTDNKMDETDDLMDSVKERALARTQHYVEKGKSTPKKKESIISSDVHDNIDMDILSKDDISNMSGGDDMVQMFLDNQESTPGFE